jgi:hypothetical protein
VTFASFHINVVTGEIYTLYSCGVSFFSCKYLITDKNDSCYAHGTLKVEKLQKYVKCCFTYKVASLSVLHSNLIHRILGFIEKCQKAEKY